MTEAEILQTEEPPKYLEHLQEIKPREILRLELSDIPSGQLIQVLGGDGKECYQEVIAAEPEGMVQSRYLGEVSTAVREGLGQKGSVILIGPPGSGKSTLFTGSPTLSSEDNLGAEGYLPISCESTLSWAGKETFQQICEALDSEVADFGDIEGTGMVVVDQFNPSRDSHRILADEVGKLRKDTVYVYSGWLSNQAKREVVEECEWLTGIPIVEVTNQSLNEVQRKVLGTSKVVQGGFGIALEEAKELERYSRKVRKRARRGGKNRDKESVNEQYESLPVLSCSDIPQQSGFATKRDYELFCRQTLQGIIQDPTQVVDKLDGFMYDKSRIQETRDMFLEWSTLPEEEQAKIAKQLLSKSGCMRLGISGEVVDLVGVDVLRAMTEQYPNLTFFRGAEYEFTQGFNGSDFSPGVFWCAFDHVEKDMHGEKRYNPVLVMATFSDALKAYDSGSLMIASEMDWDRSSLELINIDMSSPQETISELLNARIFRLPGGEGVRDLLLGDFKQKAIKVEE